jgi:glucans biosynthesis protein
MTDGREIEPMLGTLRCGAKTRRGTACRSPAVAGKPRCRMHGGAFGSGAPMGNTNALKHGRFTRKAIEERRALRQLMRDANAFLKELGQ